MSRLLVFNPEHDYALADAHKHYYPPAGVVQLRRRFKYLPALSANPGDFWIYESHCISADTLLPASNYKATAEVYEIVPWGWDPAIKSFLLKMGFSPHLMPSDGEIEVIRELSHRRLATQCNDYLGSTHGALELFNLKDALEYFRLHPDCCFKAPWSSSGRGVMFCKDLAIHAVSEWITGVLNKQGSIMVESTASKVIDFASLWIVKDSSLTFRGVSVSITDHRGRYKANLYGPQRHLLKEISRFTTKFDDSVFNRQRDFLNEKVAPYYNGPLGIDMLIDDKGEIRPCLEINLRNTMGHVAMDIQEALDAGRNEYINKVIRLIPPIFIPLSSCAE